MARQNGWIPWSGAYDEGYTKAPRDPGLADEFDVMDLIYDIYNYIIIMNLIEYHIYLKSMIKYVEYQIYQKQTRPPDIKPSKTVPNKCRASTKQRLFWA